MAEDVVLVTGSSRGIGKAIALELAERGYTVAVHYVQREEKGRRVVERIHEKGGRAAAFQADLQSIDSIPELFDRVEQELGQLYAVINNAAVMNRKRVDQVQESEFDQLFGVNVKGLFFACQEAAKRLPEGGRIVNISSSVTRMMLTNLGLYAASKGAVEQLTRVLARELGGRKITVNSVAPGPTQTDMFFDGNNRESVEVMASMSALGRLGEPPDIAQVVAFLLTPEAAWITGQSIGVNGGFAA